MDLNKLPANDLAKLCCDAGNLAAWNEFVRRFQRPIALAVQRKARKWGGAAPEVVDDLVQDIFMRLCADQCKVLKKFAPKGEDSIVGYLVVVARNVAHDHFRATMAQRAGGDTRLLVTDDGDLDFIPTQPRPTHGPDWSLRLGEIDSALKSLMPEPVTERDYNIFWMYFQQGFTASEIGAISAYRLTVKGVEASIHRTKELLKKIFQDPEPLPKGFPRNPAIDKENG